MRWPLKTTPITAAIILLCILCVSSGRASDQASERDSDIAFVLLSLERSKFRALQQADTDVLNAIFDDALMLVDSNGELSAKAAYLEALRNSATIPLHVVPESMTAKAFGSMAIVVGIYNETEMKAGHPIHRRCRFIDTWQFKNGKWVCIAATATSAIS